MVWGNLENEHIVLNEQTLWSGSAANPLREDAYADWKKVTGLLLAGKITEAEKLAENTLTAKEWGMTRGRGPRMTFGCYQTLGSLDLVFTQAQPTSGTYRRTLNLGTGATTIQSGNHQRTVRALKSPNVLALVEDADGPYDFTLKLSRKENAIMRVEGDDLVMEGQLRSNDVDKPGVRYHTRLRVRAEATSCDIQPSGIILKGVRGRTVVAFAVRTSFTETDPATKAKADLDLALPNKDKGANLANAVLSGQAREPMARFSLEIEGTPPEVLAMDIPARVARMKKGEDDPDLIATYAQFGRHLLVGSSAPDSALPANLQGLWAEEYTPPWNADYHTNINVQMNYWPAHPANLADHAAPYHRYIFALAKSGEAYAKQYFRARGWQGGISSNAWAVAAPGDPGSAGWTLLPAVNGWLAEDLVRHFDYTGTDLEFLAKAYPVIKGAAQFYQDTLIELPGRGLVTSPSSSPENAYRLPNGEVHKMCLGATMDLQVATSAMTSAYRLAATLETDKAESESWAKTVKRIAPMKIGPDGRLQEWLETYSEPEPHHRHVSHLWGLYPGNLISLRLTPELAAAARATLEKRTDASTGWSMAWKACFWARLHDGDRAYKLLRLLVGRGDPNLLCEHPPFQIDGNFGGTAAICEMLVQTNGNEIELLPALPSAWKKGRVRGICVIGANELSFAWERQADGSLKIRNLTVKSGYMKKVQLRVGNKVQIFDVEPGQVTPINF
jgi:alpha-L-fucosidase 2